ncbi:MAG: serine hydrolase [Altererythrobacter sp.]|nr:serine hydrolase [Altererythrobacter sp.]MBK61979.1 serine hydrolase [Altererythrobacter sp.]|tara:strand:- start:718 stop:2082 length:1365 start_codon:yes stop_codon:yes gene_type:complete
MKQLRRAALALAPAMIVFGSTTGLAQDAERMDEAVSASSQDNSFMGTALVAIGDEILLDKGYGSANLEWDISNTTDTKFRIGSVTKQFTAAAILLLQERGQLDIDQPVKTYWPEAPLSWDGITLRHLLHHTSGIPNVTNFDEFSRWKFLPTTRDEMISRFADKELDFPPGEKWSYSNSGYLLLTAVVEEVSGQSYSDFIEENFFTPLGMSATAIDLTAQIVPKRASGYSPSDSGPLNADYVDMGIPSGAGALYSTTGDLLKWQRGLFGGKVLKPETVALMTDPAVEAMPGSSYAMGLLVTEDEDGQLIWHGGGIEGFNAFLAHDPERDITVAVLANINGGAANRLGQSLVTLARGGEIELASERTEVAVDPASLREYEGSYELGPGFILKFWVEGDQLMTQATNQSAFPMFAKGPDQFFLKVVDAKLVFDRDTAGEVTSVTLHQNGAVMEGSKQ